MPANDSSQKFVPRFEKAIMQYAILSKASQGEVTRENLKQTFSGNMKMEYDHFDHCMKELVQDGHLKEQNGKFTVTDDGREDIQKLQHLVLELPNVVKERQGMQGQKATAGGMQGQSGSTGSSQQPGNVRPGGMGGAQGATGQGAGSQQGQNRTGNR